MPLHLTRRRFLKSTAATAGAVAFAGPVYRALAAEEAAAYGLIDHVTTARTDISAS